MWTKLQEDPFERVFYTIDGVTEERAKAEVYLKFRGSCAGFMVWMEEVFKTPNDLPIRLEVGRQVFDDLKAENASIHYSDVLAAYTQLGHNATRDRHELQGEIEQLARRFKQSGVMDALWTCVDLTKATATQCKQFVDVYIIGQAETRDRIAWLLGKVGMTAPGVVAEAERAEMKSEINVKFEGTYTEFKVWIADLFKNPEGLRVRVVVGEGFPPSTGTPSEDAPNQNESIVLDTLFYAYKDLTAVTRGKTDRALALDLNEIKKARQTGSINAIKVCREYSASGLKEAKDFVEAYVTNGMAPSLTVRAQAAPPWIASLQDADFSVAQPAGTEPHALMEPPNDLEDV